MPAKWRNTEYVEVPPDSPQEDMGIDAAESTRTIDVAWSNSSDGGDPTRQQAILDFLGGNFVKTFNGGQYVSRLLPHAHPDWQQYDPVDGNFHGYYLFAEKARVRPRGQPVTPGGLPPASGVPPPKLTGQLKSQYDTILANRARMEISYTTRPYDLLPDSSGADGGFWNGFRNSMPVDSFGNPDESSLLRFVTKRPVSAGQYLHIPSGTFKVVPSTGPPGNAVPTGTPAIGSPGRVEPRVNLSLTWHLVPTAAVGTRALNNSLAHPQIDHLAGHVNKNALWGFDPGTILFDTWEAQPHVDPYGARVWDVTYHFVLFSQVQPIGSSAFKEVGHNYLFYIDGTKADTGYYLITDDGTSTGNTIYPAGITYNDGSGVVYDLADLFRCPQ